MAMDVRAGSHSKAFKRALTFVNIYMVICLPRVYLNRFADNLFILCMRFLLASDILICMNECVRRRV